MFRFGICRHVLEHLPSMSSNAEIAAVLGKEFVEKSFASADDFNMPMQELATEYCWGYVWGREQLDKKTRSLLNLAMLHPSIRGIQRR